MDDRFIITYYDVDYHRCRQIWHCCISCEKCPFRFRCFTQGEILSIPYSEYIDECSSKGIDLIKGHLLRGNK